MIMRRFSLRKSPSKYIWKWYEDAHVNKRNPGHKAIKCSGI